MPARESHRTYWHAKRYVLFRFDYEPHASHANRVCLMVLQTLIAWSNFFLRTTGKAVSSVCNDFRDGTRLVSLLNSMQPSAVPVELVMERPAGRDEHLRNIALVLGALPVGAAVGVTAERIESGDRASTIHLLFTLALHFQVPYRIAGCVVWMIPGPPPPRCSTCADTSAPLWVPCGTMENSKELRKECRVPKSIILSFRSQRRRRKGGCTSRV